MINQVAIKDTNNNPIAYQPLTNGKGRHKGQAISLTALLRGHLATYPADARAVILALLDLAKKRDMRAIELVFDRIDGRVTDRYSLEAEIPVRLVFQPVTRPAFIEGEYHVLPPKGLAEGEVGLGETGLDKG